MSPLDLPKTVRDHNSHIISLKSLLSRPEIGKRAQLLNDLQNTGSFKEKIKTGCLGNILFPGHLKSHNLTKWLELESIFGTRKKELRNWPAIFDKIEIIAWNN